MVSRRPQWERVPVRRKGPLEAESGSRAGGVDAGLAIVAVAFEVAVKAGAADAQDLGSAQAVAIAHLKDFLDVVFANFVERERLPVFVSGQAGGAMLEMFGKITEVDEIAGSGDAGGGDDVLEFANISGPGVLQKNRLRAASQAGNILSIRIVIFLQEELDEEGNVFQALGERRNADLNGAETVEKIFAETAGENFSAKIAIGGGDEPDVDLLDFRRADALNFAVLNDAEELGLHGERSFTDFIEKNGASVGVFEETGPGISGAGESTADMAEELAFEEGVDQRGAIADRQTLLRNGADLMNGAGDKLFAGTGRANEKNVGVVARDFAGKIKNFQHCGTLADDAVEFEVLQKLFFEGANTATLIIKRGDVVEGAFEP